MEKNETKELLEARNWIDVRNELWRRQEAGDLPREFTIHDLGHLVTSIGRCDFRPKSKDPETIAWEIELLSMAKEEAGHEDRLDLVYKAREAGVKYTRMDKDIEDGLSFLLLPKIGTTEVVDMDRGIQRLQIWAYNDTSQDLEVRNGPNITRWEDVKRHSLYDIPADRTLAEAWQERTAKAGENPLETVHEGVIHGHIGRGFVWMVSGGLLYEEFEAHAKNFGLSKEQITKYVTKAEQQLDGLREARPYLAGIVDEARTQLRDTYQRLVG